MDQHQYFREGGLANQVLDSEKYTALGRCLDKGATPGGKSTVFEGYQPGQSLGPKGLDRL